MLSGSLPSRSLQTKLKVETGGGWGWTLSHGKQSETQMPRVSFQLTTGKQTKLEVWERRKELEKPSRTLIL